MVNCLLSRIQLIAERDVAVTFKAAITECIHGSHVNRRSVPCVSVTVVSIQLVRHSFRVLLRHVWKIRGLRPEYRVVLRCDAVWFCKDLTVFRRTFLQPPTR